MTEATPEAVDPAEEISPKAVERPALWRQPKLIVAAVVVLILVGVVVAVTRDSGPPSSASAVETCRQLVRDKLKSPATAHFDADKPVAVSTNSSGSGKGSLLIDGTVDSENGFGANVRSTYACVAEVQGDHWNINPDDVLIF